MLLNLADLSEKPLDQQITEQVLDKILAGDMRGGEPLAPAAKLARGLRLSVRTVERAYRTLLRMGVIASENGGEYVVATLSEEKKRGCNGAVKLGDHSPLEISDPRIDAELIEKKRMEQELVLARRIQLDLLPAELPRDERYTLAAYWEPSLEVGGDFYDALKLDNGRLAVVIADASGKGLPAALVSAQVQSILRSEIHHGGSIAEILSSTNDHFTRYSATDRFTTLFYGEFDPESGEFHYANAGHHRPLLVRFRGGIEELNVGDKVLGLFLNEQYETGSVRLRSGDFLCLFTDGVVEAEDESGQCYDRERLRALLEGCRRLEPEKVIRLIVADLTRFLNGTKGADDTSLLILKRRKPLQADTENASEPE